MFEIQELRIDPELYSNPLCGIHLKVLCYLGFIMDKTQKRKYKFLHLLRAYFVAFIFISATLVNFIKVSRSLNNLEQSAISCASGCLFLSTSVMIVNACIQHKRIIALVTFLCYDWKSLQPSVDDIENMYFQKTVRFVHLLTWFIFGSSLVGSLMICLDCVYRTIFFPETVFNVPEIISGSAEPILLFKIFPYGETYDNFIVGYLTPYGATGLTLTYLPIGHTFMICFMRYIIVKYKIIIKRMKELDVLKIHQNIHHNDGKDISSIIQNSEYWYLKLCEFCVDEQIKIRWFFNELEILLRVPIFINFLIYSVFFCFIFYAINSGSLSGFDYICMFIYLVVVLSTSWIYYWHATLIAECNDDLCFAIYSSDWYNRTLKIQKTLFLIMTNTYKPLQMRAIFIDMNLTTFVDTIRGAYAYFSILRSVNDDEIN